MATYRVYGTAKASPSDGDWELLEDGHVVLDRV